MGNLERLGIDQSSKEADFSARKHDNPFEQLSGGKKSTSKFAVSVRDRNKFRKSYQASLAHHWLNEVQTHKPFLYDRMRESIDPHGMQTKLSVSCEILRSKEPHKFMWFLYFLWSGSVPEPFETAYSNVQSQSSDSRNTKSQKWRDEATKNWLMLASVCFFRRSYSGLV